MPPLRAALTRAALQSASIMTVADVAMQLLVEDRTLPFPPDDLERGRPYDPLRTMRWTTVGLTMHGPYFHLAFRRLDEAFGAGRSWSVVLKKTVAGQLLVFPPYLVALFSAMGLMEQGLEARAEDVTRAVRSRVPPAFVAGCAFWPVANCFNFAFVPTGMRVPYVAAVGGIWNGYLSYMNARKREAGR